MTPDTRETLTGAIGAVLFPLIVALLLLWVAPCKGAELAKPPVIILEFHAPAWCKPCRKIEPLVRKLIAEKTDIRQIDVDGSSPLPRMLKIKSIPAFIRFEGTKETGRLVGLVSEKELRRFCKGEPKK